MAPDSLPPPSPDSSVPWSRKELLRFDADVAVSWVDTNEADLPYARSVSYAELIDMADRVSCLVAHAASRGAGVGLCLDNSLAAVACQLGILWAGNNFVPLDEPSAQPRTQEVLENSGIELIFCGPHLADDVARVVDECRHKIIVLSIDDAELTNPSCARFCMMDAVSSCRPDVPHNMCSRICTFHTSGTTGAPKPIHSTAEQWRAFVLAAARPYHLTATSRVFVATSAIFDPSAGMTFAALALGATVCLAPWAFTLQQLRVSINLTRATHAMSTPSVWALYDIESECAPHDKLSLTTVMLGGEPTPPATIRAWLALGVRLINTYGTTEATVYQMAYELPPHVASLSDAQLEQHARCLGTPFEGICCAAVHVPALLEGLSEAVPADGLEIKELVLWGTQVGGPDRWGMPNVASRAIQGEDTLPVTLRACGGFIPSTSMGEWRLHPQQQRLRTGDLVQCRGGAMYYVGRADQQVKLNGRRIELGPIGNAICMAMHPLVRHAVVQLVDGRLHAFCVMRALPDEMRSSPRYTVTSDAVRVLCGLELPAYLVPPSVTLLSDLPRTPTGKTDGRALAALALADAAAVEAGHGTGSTPWCPYGWLGVVAACWSQELNLPVGQLSGTSDFRALSGDSLVALKICTRLWRHQQQCTASRADGGVFGELMGAFSPVHLLATPVLREYAARLQAAAAETKLFRAHIDGGDQCALPPCDQGAAADASVCASSSGSGCRAVSEQLDALAVQAVAAGDAALLQVLLQRYPPLVPLPLANRLLLAAVCNHDGACAALMLAHGASPNASSHCSATTALQSAVLHTDNAMVQRLLAACADVRAVDQNLQSVLHHAARTGADNGCLETLISHGAQAAGVGGGGAACASLDIWGRTPLHWAVINGHREAIITLVEAGSDISVRDLQHESSLDLAERRALCQDVAASGKCDRLTVNLLKLLLPPEHPDHRSFHPEGFMDLCTHEVLEHAARLRLSAEARDALLAMSPERRAAIGDHMMTIDELNARRIDELNARRPAM